jgi:hypothetical protein
MSDATFGDFDDDDAFGNEPADPEQVARKLHEFRLARQRETVDWDGLTNGERLVLIAILADLLAWGRRQGVFR